MPPSDAFAPLCAIRRTDALATDALIAAVAEHARKVGLKLAGVLQRDERRPGRTRCDTDLVDLASGRVIRISEDRGELARGCRMDGAALIEAAAMVEDSISNGAPDLVILNKFGKAEEEGGGMRGAIATALDASIPVLMSVGAFAAPALERFAGDLCAIVEADATKVSRWLFARLNAGRTIPEPRFLHADFGHC